MPVDVFHMNRKGVAADVPVIPLECQPDHRKGQLVPGDLVFLEQADIQALRAGREFLRAYEAGSTCGLLGAGALLGLALGTNIITTTLANFQ